MAKKERIQEQIQQIADKVKFLRTSLLALVSGSVWLLFSISLERIKFNYVTASFLYVGITSMIVVALMIGVYEHKRTMKIDEVGKL